MKPVPTGGTETLAQQAAANRKSLAGEQEPVHRILVVEDDRDLRHLNTEVLTHYGYHVDAAEDGMLAWERLGEQSYDLMITDNRMPNMSGLELLKKMHATNRALPTVMATSEVPKAEFQNNPWLEPAAILSKPYTVMELVEKVRKVLAAQRKDSVPTALAAA